MHVLYTCKNEEDPIKNEGARVAITFLLLLLCGDFFRRSRAANSTVCGLIWQYFQLLQHFMVVLVTRKNEEDPMKKEGVRAATKSYIDFSDAQVQLTP